MLAFLSPLLTFLGGPVITGLINAYKAKLDAANTTDGHAIDLAKADIAAQIQAREEAVALSGGRTGSMVQFLFAVPVIGYVFKVILWDKVVGAFVGCSGPTAPHTCETFSTDPITGDVATWVAMIIGFYFGAKILSGIADVVSKRFMR